MKDSRVERESESDEDCYDPEFDPFVDFAVQTQSRSLPINDEVSEYLARGCGCQKYGGRPCSPCFACSYLFFLQILHLDVLRRHTELKLKVKLNTYH